MSNHSRSIKTVLTLGFVVVSIGATGLSLRKKGFPGWWGPVRGRIQTENLFRTNDGKGSTLGVFFQSEGGDGRRRNRRRPKDSMFRKIQRLRPKSEEKKGEEERDFWDGIGGSRSSDHVPVEPPWEGYCWDVQKEAEIQLQGQLRGL